MSPPFTPIYNGAVTNALSAGQMPMQPQPQGGVPNALQGSPDVQAVAGQQSNALQPGQAAPPQNPPPPPPSPQKIQELHGHLSDTQKVLRDMIRLPDDELSLKKLYQEASDQISKFTLSRGSRGYSAMDAVKAMSDPNFPREDDKGNPPSPQLIRSYLQQIFNSTVLTHAHMTMKYGPPAPQPQPPSSSTNMVANSMQR